MVLILAAAAALVVFVCLPIITWAAVSNVYLLQRINREQIAQSLDDTEV